MPSLDAHVKKAWENKAIVDFCVQERLKILPVAMDLCNLLLLEGQGTSEAFCWIAACWE
jgi:hypothetical protein